MILDTTESDLAPEIREIRAAVAGGNGGRIPLKNLPFTPGDVTCGLENEMQAAVLGAEDDVASPAVAQPTVAIAIANSKPFMATLLRLVITIANPPSRAMEIDVGSVRGKRRRTAKT